MNDSNVIGAILGMERTNLSLTISKVCDGLCSASTYNRYESGKMLPDKFMLSALLERMGKNPNRIVYTVTDEEHKLLDIRKKLKESILDNDYERTKEYFDEYSDIPKTRCKNIHKQLEFEIEGELCRMKGDTEETLSLYRKALEQTFKKKSLDNINESLYTVREFKLLYKIGEVNDFDLLFKLGYFLKKLANNHYLKIVFYGDLIADLVAASKDRWMKQMQLEYLEDALQYKRQIKQSRGLSRLLKMKKDILGKLDREEEILLGMETLMG